MNFEFNPELALEVSNVSKQYQIGVRSGSLRGVFTGKKFDRPTVNAINEISFQVKKGEVLGLVGRNGSGKSTLIRMLGGIYRPSRGQIFIRGRAVALVELGAGFDQQLSGRENIYMNASGHGLSRTEIEPEVEGIIEMTGIGHFIDFPLETYSSGMRARLGFSIAAALKPEVLLADEITAVGDASFTEQCFEHFERVRHKGTTVVLASHNLKRLKEVADRVAWLDGGYLKMLGDPSEVVKEYRAFMNSENH